MNKNLFIGLCLGGVLVLSGITFAQDTADDIRNRVDQTIRIRQETQESEDQWASERETLSAKYDELIKRQKQQKDLRDALKKDIQAFTAENDSLTRQIEDARNISLEIRPYLEDVFKRLEETVIAGSPFLMEERTSRLKNLRTILDDPGIDVSEKFRKVMEAVFIEAEYGNTIDVYPQKITTDGKEIQAQIFRLGRLSLFFSSLDRKQTGYFDVNEKRWEILPENYNRHIGTAIDIGSKKRPVDLIDLPLGRISMP